MKFPKTLAARMSLQAQRDRPRHYGGLPSHFLSQEARDYVNKYFDDEPDVAPKSQVDEQVMNDYHTFCNLFENKTKEERFAFLENLSLSGNVNAMYYYACCLCTGKGCTADVIKGLTFLSQAAALEQPFAQWSLGRFYYNGTIQLDYSFGTVPASEQEKLDDGLGYQDRALSAFWKYRAAMNGLQDAQYWYADDCLSRSYDIYFDLDVDLMLLFNLAANQGYTPAQNTYVRILLNDSPDNVFFNLEEGIAAAQKYNLNNNIDIREKIDALLEKEHK